MKKYLLTIISIISFLSINALFHFHNFSLYAETSLNSTENFTNSTNLNISENLICLKCHKGKYSLQNMVKKLHITTGEELFKVLRKGPKAGIHKPRTDEQIEQAIKYLNLPSESSKK